MAGPIFYIARILPDYRIPVLEALNENLGGRLVVGSGDPPPGSSLESLVGTGSTAFERVDLPNYWYRGETFHAQQYKPIFEKYDAPAVVLTEESPRTVSLPWLLWYAQRRGASRVLWGHFSSNNRRFSPWHPIDRYRLELARRVEACVCYSIPIQDILRGHIDENRLFVARNTTDIDRSLQLQQNLAAKGKPKVRRELGIPTDTAVVVFLGRLIPRKGTRELLDVYRRVRRTRPTQLLVIGDGPERTDMESRVQQEGLEEIRFLGSITDKERLGPYLFAADVMLIPGYLGLAVNDAFAFGLPVVSREAPAAERFHSPEIAYVEPGHNGELAESDNVGEMSAAVERVLEDQARYSAAALRYAHNHLKLDQMVTSLTRAVEFAE